MNTHLILRHLLIAVLFITVGACSFKKNPKSTSDEATVEILQTQKTAPLDLEAIVSQKDSQKAIEDLSKIKIEDIDGKHTVDGTLLDTAIRLEKVDLIHYLVLRGANPFVISDASYKTMEHNQKINDVMRSLYKDAFFNILRNFPRNFETENYALYDNTLNQANLGAGGCLNYLDFLMNIKYFWQTPQGAGLYYQGASYTDIEAVILRTLNKSNCADYKNQFNIAKVTEWISNELIHQFYKDFEADTFIKLLLTLPKERFLKIKVTNTFDNNLPRQLRIDPLAFVVLKKPCMENHVFEEWYNLFLNLERGGYNHSDSYTFGTKSEIENCNDPLTCASRDGNHTTLMYIFKGLLLSKDSSSLKNIENYISIVADDYDKNYFNPTIETKDIREILCSQFHGDENE